MSCIKLNDEQVAQARKMYRDGNSYDKIACVFRLNRSTVRAAILGLTQCFSNDPVKDEERRPRNFTRYGHSISSRQEIEYKYAKRPNSTPCGRKLSEDQVADIRSQYQTGDSFLRLSKRFGVSKTSIKLVVKNKTYKDPAYLPVLRTSISHNTGRPTKLTELQASYIKWHLNIGCAVCLLSKYFKVSETIIYSIARGLTFKKVKMAESAPSLYSRPEQQIRLRGERLKVALCNRGLDRLA